MVQDRKGHRLKIDRQTTGVPKTSAAISRIGRKQISKKRKLHGTPEVHIEADERTRRVLPEQLRNPGRRKEVTLKL